MQRINNFFYRDGYSTLIKIVSVQAIVICLLFALFFIFFNRHYSKDFIFGMTQENQVFPSVPLSRPNLSSPALKTWVSEAAAESMTFGFYDWDRRLQAAARYFTPKGFRSFNKSLSETGVLNAVRKDRQIVSAMIQSAPVIRREGLMRNGVYRWELEISIELTYETVMSASVVRRNVQLVVIRDQNAKNASGIAIDNWQEVAG